MLRGAIRGRGEAPCTPASYHARDVRSGFLCCLGAALLPLLMLHVLHSTAVLFSVSCPPRECGVMWSIHALFGLRPFL